jgi:endonuclease YncB( thermonuclease family)
MGKEATKYVKSLVKPGDKVTMEFDIQQKDRYSRILGGETWGSNLSKWQIHQYHNALNGRPVGFIAL